MEHRSTAASLGTRPTHQAITTALDERQAERIANAPSAARELQRAALAAGPGAELAARVMGGHERLCVSGPPLFRARVAADLTALGDLPSGARLLALLLTGRRTVQISFAPGLWTVIPKPDDAAVLQVKIDPGIEPLLVGADGEALPSPSYLSLGHELIHAVRMAENAAQFLAPSDPAYSSREEEHTIAGPPPELVDPTPYDAPGWPTQPSYCAPDISENQLRQEAGARLRYGHHGYGPGGGMPVNYMERAELLWRLADLEGHGETGWVWCPTAPAQAAAERNITAFLAQVGAIPDSFRAPDEMVELAIRLHGQLDAAHTASVHAIAQVREALAVAPHAELASRGIEPPSLPAGDDWSLDAFSRAASEVVAFFQTCEMLELGAWCAQGLTQAAHAQANSFMPW